MTTAPTTLDASTGPFYRTLPLWVLDVASQANIRGREIVDAKVTAKQAVLTLTNGETPKVFRRFAFPGRAA